MSLGWCTGFVNVGLLRLLNRCVPKIDEVASEQAQNGEFGEDHAIARNKSAKLRVIRITIGTRFNHTILRFSPFFRF